MALTELSIKNAKPTGKIYKLHDEKGMYVHVTPSGSKYFRMDYRFGKRKTLALGVYPETSLKEARDKRDAARKLLEDGINPSEAKKAKKLHLITEVSNTFQAVAAEWHEKMKGKWSAEHAAKKWDYLEKDIFPTLGNTPIKNISARELLTPLERFNFVIVYSRRI